MNRAAGPVPRVTIGMPVYNGACHVAQAIDSLLSQTFGDFELIIADNASTDRTGDICREYQARDPRVRYIRHATNRGAVFNWNFVVAEARGQYELLAKKGEGLKRIVDSCGGAQQAFQLLMLEHMDTLSRNAASAIANIKFDKVVVWDGGKGTTANFLQSLAGALPPTLQIIKDIGGVEMPEYFGKVQGPEAEAPKGAGEAEKKS